jgi:hypothetical protein
MEPPWWVFLLMGMTIGLYAGVMLSLGPSRSSKKEHGPWERQPPDPHKYHSLIELEDGTYQWVVPGKGILYW